MHYLDVTLYALFVARELREGNSGQPIGVKRCLGWTVAVPNQNSSPMNDVYFCQTCESHDQQLFEDVKIWWNIETYGPIERPSECDDDKAHRLLAKTCRKTVDGRYKKGLP